MIVPVLIGLGVLWGAYELFGKHDASSGRFPPGVVPPPPGLVGPSIPEGGGGWLTRQVDSTPVVVTSPSSPSGLDDPRHLAELVSTEIIQKGMRYDHDLVAHFQRFAPGLKVDGLYGPKTAGAVQYFTGGPAPAPLYLGAGGSSTIVPYTPA